MSCDNIFNDIPASFQDEIFTDLIKHPNIRIERILSKGQVTPENEWYDQEQNEWVILLKGRAKIAYENGKEVQLNAGDYLNIPAHVKHRVSWTDPDDTCVWLAIFY